MFERTEIPRASAGVPITLLVTLGLLVCVAIAFLITSRSGPSQTPSTRRAWLVDQAAERELTFRHVAKMSNHFYFPEIMSGGVCLLDYDRDLDLDVYCIQGGDLHPGQGNKPANQLFRNRGDGTFEDVSEEAGVDDANYGMGCTCGDFDRDGDEDIYVTNVGPNSLLRNNGNGTFTEISKEAGVDHDGWGTSSAFVDYDNDGFLDLFVVNYLNWSVDREMECFAGSGRRDYCHPNNYNAPAADVLLHNNGNETFSDVSERAGINAAFGNGLGVTTADFNADGLPDIYVANDGMANQLWFGKSDGTLRNDAVLAGCAVNLSGAAEAGMGVAALDVDHDGDQDLFMTHLREETNTIYLNSGGWFEDATAEIGLSSASIPYTGFGLGFADFDHDGNYDLYVANGRVGIWEPSPDPDDPYAEPDLLFAGEAGARFASRSGLRYEFLGAGRGAAFGDLDQDGDVDAVVINSDRPAYLLINQVDEPESALIFDVRDENRHRADNAVVEIEVALNGQGPETMLRRSVGNASSYCSSADPRVHVGIGLAREARVHVLWPSGLRESFGKLASGYAYRLQKGTGTAETMFAFR